MTKLQWMCVGLLTIGLGVGVSRTAVIALAQAGGPPAQEKAEPAPSAPTAPKAPEPPRPSEPPARQARAQDIFGPIEAEIAVTTAQREQAENQLAWSKLMYTKGYASNAQVRADKIALDRAMEAYKRAIEKWRTGEEVAGPINSRKTTSPSRS